MKYKILIFIGLCAFIAIADASADGQAKVPGNTSFTSLSKAEIELLLTDIAKTNPKILEQLSKDPELRKKQIESLKQLLAFASQAVRDGLASGPTNRQELDNIRTETLAMNYDRELNKAKPAQAPLGSITEDQVAAYWAKDKQAVARRQRTHEAEFNDFLNAKIEILKASDPEMKDREISEDERTQARDVFAKTRIYKAEFDEKAKAGKFSKVFIDKANVQVKLQQAQFLARIYSAKIADKTKVTDREIAKYIAEHAELDTTAKKAKAQKILDRVKGGEDFAALANEFSEDPGNKNGVGEPQGGIYRDVPAGMMVPAFEQAALALQPGQVAPNLVETDLGYHIIKLEKKAAGKDGAGQPTPTYDVRHILIATGYKDPSASNARDIPVKDYVRGKLENEREKQVLDKIMLENNISVPEDFTVPEVVDGQPIEKVKTAPVRKKHPAKKRR